MSTYVISDIHGCYDTFLSLLNKVNFNDNDKLYILGDIIDRGPKTYEMYQWVKERLNKNVFMILGNHEDEFLQEAYGLKGRELYFKVKDEGYVLQKDEKLAYDYFTKSLFGMIVDHYKTIKTLQEKNKLSIDEITEMAMFFDKLPLYYEIEINNKKYTLVHASCEKNILSTQRYTFLWDRKLTEGYFVENKNVIFGHTPTITPEYQGCGGIVIDILDDNTSKINIDCGCVWNRTNSKLGILRLDDFYIEYEKNLDIL